MTLEVRPARFFSPPPRPFWLRYLAALAVFLVAWFAREAATPLLGPTAVPFIFFFAAVAAAAWLGGAGPALLAIILSATTATVLFLGATPAPTKDGWQDVATITAFVLSALVIAGAIQAAHYARARALDELAERVRLEGQIAQEKELLARTLASIGDAVIATNERGEVSFLNAEAERLTGWKSSEASGRPLPDVFRIVNETTRQPVENPVEKVIRTGGIVGLANHTVLISRQNLETPIDDTAAPIRQAGGRIFGVVLVFRDVTEQRRADRSKAHLAAIVEYSGDVILTKDLQGRILSWNASAERLFGYTAQEIIGQPVTVLFPPDRLHEEDRILAHLREGGPVERLETVRIAKDGRRIPVSLTVSPLKDSDGKIIGASKTLHDITDLVAAREALHLAHTQLSDRALQLETLVAERTAKLAEMVNELQHFSYAIVHDMRAPLRAMNTFASEVLEYLVSSPSATPQVQDYCRRIIIAAARLDRLIQDSLNYTKSVLQDVQFQSVDLGGLITGLLDTYPNLHPSQAEITIEDPLPVVWGEESLLTQCFSNLLGNAVKFVTPGTRPRIRIRTGSVQTLERPDLGRLSTETAAASTHAKSPAAQKPKAEAFVRITIEDNGIGIPSHAQKRLFGMFERLTTGYDGNGIGLAIVRKVVERMGGRVGAESKFGMGSQFWVELRVATGERPGNLETRP
jgi:PAS domain S-box-containing protein